LLGRNKGPIMENQVIGLGNVARTAAAFERVKAEFFALRPDELQQVSLDITAAFATVMGVLPELRVNDVNYCCT
jgi:hypothetical protein